MAPAYPSTMAAAYPLLPRGTQGMLPLPWLTVTSDLLP
nr:hypothetical protein Q903MT_gene2111 [Picea sitchensis]